MRWVKQLFAAVTCGLMIVAVLALMSVLVTVLCAALIIAMPFIVAYHLIEIWWLN